ncbi:MAG: nuclear transport factor 2 family protein [Microthrixaceae bacterium]|nr:nuclear transport factor 2 family protein [Microthrixaceae bacterium]
MAAPTDLASLLEHEAIKALKFAYLRCLDQKRWDEMYELFVPDGAVSAYSGNKYRYEGRDAIIDFLKRNMDRPALHTSHHVHHPEIELLGEDLAAATWAMEDVNIDVDYDFYMVGRGFYEDRYRKIGDRWLIELTGYKRLFETFQPLSGNQINMTASWWATNGESSLEVQ